MRIKKGPSSITSSTPLASPWSYHLCTRRDTTSRVLLCSGGCWGHKLAKHEESRHDTLRKTSPKLENTLVAHSCWPKTRQSFMHLFTKVRAVNVISPVCNFFFFVYFFSNDESRTAKGLHCGPLPSRSAAGSRRFQAAPSQWGSASPRSSSCFCCEVWVSENEKEAEDRKGEGRRRERGWWDRCGIYTPHYCGLFQLASARWLTISSWRWGRTWVIGAVKVQVWLFIVLGQNVA